MAEALKKTRRIFLANMSLGAVGILLSSSVWDHLFALFSGGVKKSKSVDEQFKGMRMVLRMGERKMTLNETGSFIWLNIDGRKGRDELATCVAQTYSIPKTQAVRDVEHFIKMMRKRQFLV